MAEEMFILSTCNILPSTINESTHDQRIELTPWDLQYILLGPIQKGLLFLKPPIQQQKDFINHLKMSLSRTLDLFPPLAGRLVATKNVENNTTTFSILCNNAGAQFTHATINNLRVGDILDSLYVPRIVHSFFPSNGLDTSHEGISKPLFAVQVTEFVDGFFIGCTMNHSVGDGTCFWHFFNSWSEISRDLIKTKHSDDPSSFCTSCIPPPSCCNYISKSTILGRWFPNDIICPIPIPSEQLISVDTYIPPPLEERIFHFPKENIKKLKEKANNEMGTYQISSLQALLAHIWRSVTRCRRVDSNQETSLNLLIGTRPRLRPQLPTEYFGNAIQIGVIKISGGELLENDLGWAAWQVNQFVALQTHEEVAKVYENWVKNPKVLKLSGFVSNTLGISSSPRFNVYGNDFGWGKPLAVRSGGGNKLDGKVTIFAGAEEGSIDVEVCLVPETLYAMEDDKEFMDAVEN